MRLTWLHSGALGQVPHLSSLLAGGVWKAGVPSLERDHLLGMQCLLSNECKRRKEQMFSYAFAMKFLLVNFT